MILSRFLPGIGVYIAGALTSLLAARLSRSDEYEADAYAAALLQKSGIGIGPQKTLFTKLEALTQSRAGAVPAWLMSHPKTEERIRALEELEARWSQA
jgi:putative metalloprotease